MTLDHDRLARFAADLVRIPTVLGDEGAAAERVAEEMRALDFENVHVDPVGNVLGTVAGRAGSERSVLLDAHLDTVDVQPRDAWSRDPWSGVIADGRLWGRGSSDMKGAMAAMVHGIATLDREALGGAVTVCGSVSEEQIEGAALQTVMERAQPDFVVIGEASELTLVHGGRGRAEIRLTAHGKPSHASAPHLGVNAVHEIERIHARLARVELREHPLVGPGVLCLTDIISDPYPAHSVVPSACTSTWEQRLIPGDDRESVIATFEEAARAAGARATVELSRARLTTYTGHAFDEPKWYPPWLFDTDEPFVRAARAALGAAGLPTETSCYQFCTNGAYSAGRAGVPTVGFGPSTEELAHVTDEYLELDQLLGAARGYAAIAAALLEG